MEVPQLLALATELLIYICSFLPDDDVLPFALTCRPTANAASDELHTRQKIFQQFRDIDDSDVHSLMDTARAVISDPFKAQFFKIWSTRSSRHCKACFAQSSESLATAAEVKTRYPSSIKYPIRLLVLPCRSAFSPKITTLLGSTTPEPSGRGKGCMLSDAPDAMAKCVNVMLARLPDEPGSPGFVRSASPSTYIRPIRLDAKPD